MSADSTPAGKGAAVSSDAVSAAFEEAARMVEAEINGVTIDRFIVDGTVQRNVSGHDRFLSTVEVSGLLRRRAQEIRARAAASGPASLPDDKARYFAMEVAARDARDAMLSIVDQENLPNRINQMLERASERIREAVNMQAATPSGEADRPTPVFAQGPHVIGAAPPAEPVATALTLFDLRVANVQRQAEWCPDNTPDLSFRGNELAGEVGEACNVIKKLERERQGWAGSRSTPEALAEELADVIICVDLVAMQLGIDLGAAVRAKFNATSEARGLATRIPGEGEPAKQMICHGCGIDLSEPDAECEARRSCVGVEPPAPEVEPVAVKPLEWHEPTKLTNGCWTAESILGVYSVAFDDGWHAGLDGGMPWEWEPEEDPRSYHGPTAAQRACQAHLDASIRSALITRADQP